MVARAIMHRPRDPVPRRAHRRARPAEPRSRSGRSSASCTRDGQTILLTTHYMEEADKLCNRLAIIDHGKLLALDTPGGAEAIDRRRHRRDRHRERRPRQRWRTAPRGRRGRARTHRRSASTVHRRRRGAGARAAPARVRAPPSAAASTVHRRLDRRAHARDRLHQPHREGPARMTRQPRHRHADRAAARRAPLRSTPMIAFGSLILRDLVVLRKNADGVHPPHRSCSRCCSCSCSRTCSRRSGRASAEPTGERRSRACSCAGVDRRSRCIFQGIQSVSLPMVQEFGYTREIEDRVLAPMPVWARRDARRSLAGAIRA